MARWSLSYRTKVALRVLSSLIVILGAPPLQARIFDIKSEGFATYLRSSYMTAVPGTDPFANSSGTSVVFNDRFKAMASYDFGLIFASRFLSIRTGLEVFQPPELKGVTGSTAAGASLYTFDSAVSGYALKGGLEGNLMTGKTNRFGFVSEAGLVNLTVQNSYKFTTAGTARFGLSDFREELKGTALMIAGGFLYEFLLSDTTTFFMDAGYRSLNVAALSHNLAVTNFQGAVTVGGQAYNNDLITKRAINLSGVYLAAGLRFWL